MTRVLKEKTSGREKVRIDGVGRYDWEDEIGGGGGGSSSYSFTSGVALSEDGVTVVNTLVTGLEVPHVDIHTAGGGLLALDDGGGVRLGNTALTGSELAIGSSSGDVQLTAARNIGIDAHGGTAISGSLGAAQLTLMGGAVLTASNGNVNLSATGAHDAQVFAERGVIIQGGASVDTPTRTFAIFDGGGAGQAASIVLPGTGTVQDVECRAALNTLLNALRAWGWIQPLS